MYTCIEDGSTKCSMRKTERKSKVDRMGTEVRNKRQPVKQRYTGSPNGAETTQDGEVEVKIGLWSRAEMVVGEVPGWFRPAPVPVVGMVCDDVGDGTRSQAQAVGGTKQSQSSPTSLLGLNVTQLHSPHASLHVPPVVQQQENS